MNNDAQQDQEKTQGKQIEKNTIKKDQAKNIQPIANDSAAERLLKELLRAIFLKGDK